MYAPIYLPPAPPPAPEVLATEARILEAEGAYHVEGRYYANVYDADRMRRLVAERLVREAARREAWHARHRAEPQTAPTAAKPRITAWLTPREWSQVAAVVDGIATAALADTLPAVADTLRVGSAELVVLSADRMRPGYVSDLLRLVRGFPGVSFAGIVSDTTEGQALAGTLLFGRAGVATVFDCRIPSGWASLRDMLGRQTLSRGFGCRCITAILDDIRDDDRSAATDGTISDGLSRFFAAAFAPDLTSTKQLSARLGVRASTLASRFFRAGLPSPKRYLAFARLVWAAHLGETPGLSISAIAERLDASSPQSFHRTVRTFTGQSAVQFRRAMTGDAMLDQFRTTLVAPYRDALRAFDPLGVDSISPAHAGRPTLQLGRVA